MVFGHVKPGKLAIPSILTSLILEKNPSTYSEGTHSILFAKDSHHILLILSLNHSGKYSKFITNYAVFRGVATYD
jgi:hypothetical protein